MKKFTTKKMKSYLSLFMATVAIFATGCTSNNSNVSDNDYGKPPVEVSEKVDTNKVVDKEQESSNENTKSEEAGNNEKVESTASDNEDIFAGYKLIEVDGGDLSGYRQPNVVVDIGFGDREYWAFTNEFGQLVRVQAKEIILQDDKTEPVNSNGRYYNDEAKVPGVESKYLDEGKKIVL